MSFILDALKKSENERQRHSGPGVFQPRVASPRARFPLWATAIGILLAVNLLVLIWLMTRPDELPSRPAALQATPSAPGAGAAPAAAPASATIPATAPSPAGTAAPAPVAARGAVTPFNPPLIVDPALTAPADAAAAAESNPNDYLPARPAPSPSPATTTPVSGGIAGMPATIFATRESLLARGQQVPEASLSLHVYDADPARRFVFINGQRGSEGDTLPNGLRIEQILPDGAVLSWSGNRFLVPLQ